MPEPGAARSVAAARAARGAGRPTGGTAGVSLGAAADFLRRQRALAEETRGAQPPTERVIIGEGVTVRRG